MEIPTCPICSEPCKRYEKSAVKPFAKTCGSKECISILVSKRASEMRKTRPTYYQKGFEGIFQKREKYYNAAYERRVAQYGHDQSNVSARFRQEK